jgi:hypothetical protein
MLSDTQILSDIQAITGDESHIIEFRRKSFYLSHLIASFNSQGVVMKAGNRISSGHTGKHSEKHI